METVYSLEDSYNNHFGTENSISLDKILYHIICAAAYINNNNKVLRPEVEIFSYIRQWDLLDDPMI